MGNLVELELPTGYTSNSLFIILRESNFPVTLVNLKSFRSLQFSRDPLVYINKLIIDHLKNIKDSKISFLILDKFDFWPSVTFDKEGYKLDNFKKLSNSCCSYLDSVRLSEGVEERVFKCSKNWVYKFIYWIRYSILFLSEEEFGHNLLCLCVYGDPINSKPFYEDLFSARYSIKEFLSSDYFKGFNFSGYKEESLDLVTLNSISRNLDLNGSLFSKYSLTEPLYNCVNIRPGLLGLNIPFEVNCEGLNLSPITLICGPKGSGKTTLLRSISKAWYNLFTKSFYNKFENSFNLETSSILTNTTQSNRYLTKSAFVFNLEFYELASQFVGCSESYVREIFSRAKYNSPSLIVFDGIELIFEKVQREEDRSVSVTVSDTLLNQLHNLQPDVYFLTCTTGDFDLSNLSDTFMGMVNDVIVLSLNS